MACGNRGEASVSDGAGDEDLEGGEGGCFFFQLEGKNEMQKRVKARIFRRRTKAFREALSDRVMDMFERERRKGDED